MVPRLGCVSNASPVSWPLVTGSCPRDRLRSRRLWSAIRALRPAAIGWETLLASVFPVRALIFFYVSYLARNALAKRYTLISPCRDAIDTASVRLPAPSFRRMALT